MTAKNRIFLPGIMLLGLSIASGQQPAGSSESKPDSAATPPSETPAAAPSLDDGAHDHMVQLPGGGPVLKIRGFFDFDFGVGKDSNALIYPVDNGNSAFRDGEFDLFISSKLSEKWSFLSEIVIGSDPTNAWGLDIERYQLTYRVSPYFEISGGRYHTAIGYYNTTYHHGTWFQTATGRPFMYFFEDSGGILPVHNVGLTATGLVPQSGALNLHWVAEIGNGRSSSPSGAPVQNFVTDRPFKSVNIAAYIKPQELPGLQIGGSYFIDRLYPPGLARVTQHIGSVYAVYNERDWEFMAEGVLLSNSLSVPSHTFDSPMWYLQAARKFDRYRPYFRYQFLNSPMEDPVNIFTGRYQGPSAGLRYDVNTYAALKVQYNRLDRGPLPSQNGLTLQVAFTF